LQPLCEGIDIANATAELDVEFRTCTHLLDEHPVLLGAGTCTVKVDDMQVTDLQGAELARDFDRVVAVFRDLGEVALVQTHALAVFQVDCRDNSHAANPRKLLSKRAPSVDDLSGWNCVARKLSRRHAAVNGSSCLAVASVKSETGRA